MDGTDQSVAASLAITVSDTRAVGSGWNLQLSTTTFTTGSSPARTLATNALTVRSASAACSSPGCVLPTNSVIYPASITAGTPPAPVKIFNAALLTGTGKVTVTLNLRVTVPATTMVGTYTSTLAVSILSGP